MQQTDTSNLPRGVTVRSVVLGLLAVQVVCLGAPYSIWMVRSSEITVTQFPVSAGFSFVLIYFANVLVRRLYSRWALTPAELAVILIMGLVVTGIPTFIVGTWIGIISSPYYAATPENYWAESIHPYLPEWALPSPEGEAMTWFYEGLPSAQSIPFAAWIGPLFWWLSLILTVYFVCFCLVVILRRQWVEHERLVFPLMEMPRLLLENKGKGILHSKGFWIGCSVPMFIFLFNVISFFHPGFPSIPLAQGFSFQIARDFPAITLMLYFPVVGFMFLVSTNILFSICFFFLVAVVQEGVTNRIGYDVTRPDAFVWGMQSLSWQAWGAFVAMVLLSLWMARRYLWAVGRQAFGGRRTFDDSKEMLSYRTAVYGGLAGLVYILAWLWRSGMDLHVALLFMFGVLVAYMGITRLVIQAGVYFLTAPVGGQAFALALTGTGIGGHNLVALGLSYSWFGDVQSIFMAAAANGAKLNELCRDRRAMTWAIGLAVLTGFVANVYFVLSLCYKYGAANFGSWYFIAGGGVGAMAFDGVIRHFNDPWSTDWNKLSYFGIGMVAYWLLALCQYRFHWWPLHPVGIAVAPIWMTRNILFSVFLAWVCKSVIVRIGGIAAYRSARPFFMGLIVGYFLGLGISYGVDIIWFFGQGHAYFHG